ncbi:MAG: glycosyltransferase family 2 protein [Erysipelotrichaceae bacterium]|nr:glycosyltransferase family 2 protein [Erysipelotrichaceae bacterium]
MSPKISVITPMHNDAEYVRQCIDSVLAQTYTNWEMIVVDDCSTDDSFEIVKSYGCEKIRLLHNDKNMGAAYSRNRALREADGDYVAFLDADDWWAPEKLERQLKFMQDLQIAFSCTAYYRMRVNGTRVIITAPYIMSHKRMKKCSYVGCLTAMYDRHKVGLIQVEETIRKRNDYAMWLQVSQRFDCYFLADPLAYYRVRENSLSRVSDFSLLRSHKYLFRKQMKYSWIHSWFCAVRNGYNSYRKRKRYVQPDGTELSNIFN